MRLSALLCADALSAFIGLAERLSGLFTGNMASRSVGELQEMEGEFVSGGPAVACPNLLGRLATFPEKLVHISSEPEPP